MAKEIRYWYKWEPLRFAKSPRVIRMSIGAKGAYRGILDSLWLNEGRLPNAPDVFWKYADCTPAEWEAVRAEVMPMLTPSEDGKWLTNDTLSEVWEEAAGVSKDTSEKKSAAAKARWDKARAMQDSTGAMQTDAGAVQKVKSDAQNRTEQKRREEVNPARETSNQEPTEADREEITRKIAKLHPELSHLHSHELPLNVVQEVMECIQTDGAEMVEKGVRLLADEMARKTKDEKKYCEDWQKKAYPYFKGRKYRPEVKIVKDTLTGNERCDCLDAGIDFEGKKPADVRLELQRRRRQA